MKTKTFNHFRNIFAFIGFFIIACSAAVDDSPTVVEPPVVQNNIGKYQISLTAYSNLIYMTSVNTETRVGKTYVRDANQITKNWEELNTGAFTFTH